jgi:hypothetical protein
MRRLSFLLFLAFGLALTACSSTSLPTPTLPAVEPTAPPPTQPVVAPTQASPAQPAQPVGKPATQLAELTDNQGAVTVIVKPLDLNSSPDTLSFEVTLDTHSIDLSMDLAALATLMTDIGQSVQATLWNAPLGGHHVSGTLSFPASIDGKPILDSAVKLTLIIKDVDAPERTFAWDLE